MKKIDLILNILIKLILLAIFVLFSFYKLKINILVITMTLLVFSFINSFIIKNKKISIDVEIFIFQAASVFYLERRANFKWREVPERIFDNYGYVKVLFILVFILTFIYLCIRNENKLLKKYVCSIFFILVIIENIFEIGIIYTISLLFSIPSTVLSYTRIDIAVMGIVIFLFIKKEKKFFLIYNFVILCLFVRYMTANLVWGIL